MKLELGFEDEVYGTVELVDKKLTIQGAPKNRLTIIKMLRSLGSDQAKDLKVFLASLPNRLTGHAWVRIINN